MSAKKADVSDKLVELVVVRPEPTNDGNEMIERVKSLQVTDPTSYELVSMVRHNANQQWNRYEKDRVKMKAPILEAQKNVDDFFRPILMAFANARDIATKKLSDYDTEQRRIAAEKQRQAEAEAETKRRQAEADARQARERQAELQRQQQIEEAQQREAAERQKRETAEATAREERAKREAAEAAAAGDKERAQQAEATAAQERQKAISARVAQLKAEEQAAKQKIIADQAIEQSKQTAVMAENHAHTIVADVVTPDLVAVSGLSRVATYKWKLLDKSKLKPDFTLVDEKAINALVRSAKQRAQSMVGEGAIEVYEDTSLRQR